MVHSTSTVLHSITLLLYIGINTNITVGITKERKKKEYDRLVIVTTSSSKPV